MQACITSSSHPQWEDITLTQAQTDLRHISMFGKEGGSTLRVEDEPEEAARCVQQMRVDAISRLGGCYYCRPSALSGRSRIGGQFPFAPLTTAARTLTSS